MFIDASALVAVLTGETAASKIDIILNQAQTQMFCSAIAEYEAVTAVARKKSNDVKLYRQHLTEAREIVHDLFLSFGVKIEPITEHHSRLAQDVFGRFGRGSGHPAKLNMGDCFAYAMARFLSVPLLFIGNDFNHTDIESVLPDPRP